MTVRRIDDTGAVVTGDASFWSLNADDRHHLVTVTAVMYDLAERPSEAERYTWLLTVDKAIALRDHLTQAIDGAQAKRLDDARRGDCARCQNYRMAEVETRPGYTEMQHCPDCSPARPDGRVGTLVPDVPTMPMFALEEVAVGERSASSL